MNAAEKIFELVRGYDDSIAKQALPWKQQNTDQEEEPCSRNLIASFKQFLLGGTADRSRPEGPKLEARRGVVFLGTGAPAPPYS